MKTCQLWLHFQISETMQKGYRSVVTLVSYI